jgi:hypothetical protein
MYRNHCNLFFNVYLQQEKGACGYLSYFPHNYYGFVLDGIRADAN